MVYEGYREPTNRNVQKHIELMPEEAEIQKSESAEESREPAPATPTSTEPTAPESASTEPAKNDPLKKLKRAVGKKVLEQTDTIAESLVKATIAGNSNSARIVVSLVDKRRRSESEIRKLRKAALSHKSGVSKAIELRDGPEWKDEDEAKLAGDPPASDEQPPLPEKEDAR
jgi:hypothetical protein